MKFIFSIILLSAFSGLFAQSSSSFLVNFDFNKYEITDRAAAQLDSFVTSLPANSSRIGIELFGYCDSIGSNDYNDALSQQRVNAVKKYLIDKGLPSATIAGEKSFGKRQPLNNNTSDLERALNRRVKLVINWPEEKLMVKEIEKTFTKTIEDTATKVGSKLTLRNLNFVGGMHYLLPQSNKVLQELLEVMIKNPRLVISIEGHVCCIPDNNDGVDLALGTTNLSEMRAKTVYDFLIKNNIAPARVSYKGFGHQFPINPYPERSEDERIMNRRVEVRIISK